MSLPPEKASELKQLIHQQLSKVRSSGGPAPEPSRDGGAGAGGQALRSGVRPEGALKAL